MADAKIHPFLMFEGKAEEAMNFYVSLFPGAEILDIVRYSPGQPGAEGFAAAWDAAIDAASKKLIDAAFESSAAKLPITTG